MGGSQSYSPLAEGGGPAREEVIDLVGSDLNKMWRVSKAGIRVGCSFITKNAVEHIIAEWRKENPA